jgi:hypothetical protein
MAVCPANGRVDPRAASTPDLEPGECNHKRQSAGVATGVYKISPSAEYNKDGHSIATPINQIEGQMSGGNV